MSASSTNQGYHDGAHKALDTWADSELSCRLFHHLPSHSQYSSFNICCNCVRHCRVPAPSSEAAGCPRSGKSVTNALITNQWWRRNLISKFGRHYQTWQISRPPSALMMSIGYGTAWSLHGLIMSAWYLTCIHCSRWCSPRGHIANCHPTQTPCTRSTMSCVASRFIHLHQCEICAMDNP